MSYAMPTLMALLASVHDEDGLGLLDVPPVSLALALALAPLELLLLEQPARASAPTARAVATFRPFNKGFSFPTPRGTQGDQIRP
jgi:hypothetical protein